MTPKYLPLISLVGEGRGRGGRYNSICTTAAFSQSLTLSLTQSQVVTYSTVTIKTVNE